MGLRQGERLLVMVDKPLKSAGETLCEAGLDSGAGDAALVNLSAGRGHPLRGIPRTFLDQVSQADVIVSLVSDIDLSREDPLLRAAVAAFRASGRGRWAFGAYIDEDILEHELSVDYRDVAQMVGQLAKRLERADRVRLTSPAGTDLRFSIGGRPIYQDTGLFTEPGAFGNLPAGEVYVAPVEHTTEGKLVIDQCMADFELDCPVTLEFRSGRVYATGGREATRKYIQLMLREPPVAVLGEFGIGANPGARLRGRVSVDEKVAGTVHVALGGNKQFGGWNGNGTHLDCVLSNVEVRLDGVPL